MCVFVCVLSILINSNSHRGIELPGSIGRQKDPVEDGESWNQVGSLLTFFFFAIYPVAALSLSQPLKKLGMFHILPPAMRETCTSLC